MGKVSGGRFWCYTSFGVSGDPFFSDKSIDLQDVLFCKPAHDFSILTVIIYEDHALGVFL